MNTDTVLSSGDVLVTISPARSSTAGGEQRSYTLSGSNMARFWELRGLPVFEDGGTVWGRYRGGFYSPLPIQRHLDLGQEEVDGLLRARKLRGLRFISTTRPGTPGGFYVAQPAGYGLNVVSKKQRANVRTGLERYEMRTVDPDQLLVEGMRLNRDTLRRQDRTDEMFLDPAKWKQFVHSVRQCPGVSVHGVFRDKTLAAYMISIRDGEWLHLMYKMSRMEELEHRPNHALDYSVLAWAGTVPEIRYVGNGPTALVPHEGLDRYKRQMGYAVIPHNLCLHLHPAVAPVLANRLTVSIAQQVARALPDKMMYRAAIIETAWKSRGARPEQTLATESDCQQEDAQGFSGMRRPAALFPVLRAFQTLRTGGLSLLANRTKRYVCALSSGTGTNKSVTRRAERPDEVLNLRPGEWVEVKSLEEIQATLDSRRKNRGLLFTDDMRGFAGQRLRVFKRVESIFLEESKQRRGLKNTVLLENSYCPGITFRCDRSCFLFWKEVWLRRVDGPAND